MMAPVLAWHFVGDTLRDGRPIPPDGELLQHTGPLEFCASGLHASERVIDALNYAPGATLCRVECSGTVVRCADKLVARQRTILWRIDARAVLREFARRCALEVAQLWDMPAVVRRYLETGDNALRAAAEAAARAAAWDAAWASARAATWAAADAGARAGARAAVEAAAWASARAATWAAAWAGARAAAEAAAWASARAATWAAAWDAARVAQNETLTRMVLAQREGAA